MLTTSGRGLRPAGQRQHQQQQQRQHDPHPPKSGRLRPLRKLVAVAGAATGAPQSNGTSSSNNAGGTTTTSSTSSSTRSTPQASSEQRQKRAVVVGGGWAGFGAALALAKAGASVTLLDASPNPGGLSSSFKTPGGHVVEPGIKGMWYQYANIEALVAELGIPDPFTPFTRSSFWSPQGLQVESPIFQDLPRLPAPLGSFVHTALLFRSLPLPDRATAVSLLAPLLEHDLDEELYRHYDSMSAFELFQSAGVSRQLYEQFLAPMLLVTLFAPPTELSAAAALGALYYFALAHTPDFDVRWVRGPIGELIFAPLAQRLQSLGVNIVGSRRVDQVLPVPGSSGTTGNVVVARGPDGQQEHFDADVVVLAAGIPALQQLVLKSPLLAAAPDLRAVMGVRCSDVLAVRLWLNERLHIGTPSNVVAGFDAGVGGTFFQLELLQDMYNDGPGSVLEFDLYHAEPLLPLSDEAIIHRLLHTYLPPALGDAPTAGLKVLDSTVLRFRNAVTQFSPGSNDLLPGIRTSLGNVFVAGDCVKQGPGTHGCKGLSQEKAYVSGLQAGNSAAMRLGLVPAARVIPVEPDEPHIAAAKDLLRAQRALQQLLGSSLRQAVGGSAATAGAAGNSSRAAQVTPAQDRSEEIMGQVEDLRQVLKSEVQAAAAGSSGRTS